MFESLKKVVCLAGVMLFVATGIAQGKKKAWVPDFPKKSNPPVSDSQTEPPNVNAAASIVKTAAPPREICSNLSPQTPEVGSGKHYFVSGKGRASAPCTETSPCREVRSVLDKVRPGDVIHIADGHYQGLNINVNGMAGAPISFIATGKGAFFDKTTDRGMDDRDTIMVTEASYIIIDGINVMGANRAGIRVDRSRHVTIRNSTFGDNSDWGIFTNFSDNLILEYNECFGSKRQHGIYVADSSQNPTIRFNRLHGNANCGLHMNADFSSGPPGVIHGALIEGNVIWGNGSTGGAGINMDGIQDTVVMNNVLYDNGATGIVSFKQDAKEGPKNVKILNNTVLQRSGARMAFQVVASEGPIFVRNNIFFHPTPAKSGINYASKTDLDNTDSDYNYLDRVAIDEAPKPLADFKAAHPNFEKHSFPIPELSEIFSDIKKYDLTLSATSPLKGKGLAVNEVKHDQSVRCRRPPPSIGAYD